MTTAAAISAWFPLRGLASIATRPTTKHRSTPFVLPVSEGIVVSVHRGTRPGARRRQLQLFATQATGRNCGPTAALGAHVASGECEMTRRLTTTASERDRDELERPSRGATHALRYALGALLAFAALNAFAGGY